MARDWRRYSLRWSSLRVASAFFSRFVGLAVERPHHVDGLVGPVDQALALGVGEAQLADAQGNINDGARQSDAVAAIVLGTLLLRNCGELLQKLIGLLVRLGQVVDLSGEFLQTVLQNFVGDLFLVEGDHFLDGADALFEVFAHRQQFVDDDRRARKRLQNAQLSALNALGDFNFAFAGKQRNRSHLAQIHADGIVGFFQSTGGEVEFDVLASFVFVELFVERGGGKLRSLQHIDSLRTNGGEQIVQVFRRVHIVRDEIVDLVVGEVSLFLACIDQLFNVVVLVVKSQDGLSLSRPMEGRRNVVYSGGNVKWRG